MKAADTLIAWNGADHRGRADLPPPGSVAVGPLLQHGDRDWARGYDYTGGAAYTFRRKLFGAPQQQQVMTDWYQLVYSYGVHPYTAHRAFLLISEYETVIKRYGMGPDRGEPGHDPEVCFGRAHIYPVPVLQVGCLGGSSHFWPTGEFTRERGAALADAM